MPSAPSEYVGHNRPLAKGRLRTGYAVPTSPSSKLRQGTMKTNDRIIVALDFAAEAEAFELAVVERAHGATGVDELNDIVRPSKRNGVGEVQGLNALQSESWGCPRVRRRDLRQRVEGRTSLRLDGPGR